MCAGAGGGGVIFTETLEITAPWHTGSENEDFSENKTSFFTLPWTEIECANCIWTESSQFLMKFLRNRETEWDDRLKPDVVFTLTESTIANAAVMT